MKIITNKFFFGYGLAILLYINAIFEIELDNLGLKVSELCIIGILLFVLIFIFNEINKLLREHSVVNNIKFNNNADYYKASVLNKNNIVLEKVIINTGHLIIKRRKLYKLKMTVV